MEINEDKTLQYFGYTSDMLHSNSKELVVIGGKFIPYNEALRAILSDFNIE